MSLINDALKRAQQQNQPPRPPGAPLQPVNYEHRAPNPWIFFAVVPLVILLLGIAGWFMLSGTSKKAAAHRNPGVNGVKQATMPVVSPPASLAGTEPASRAASPFATSNLVTRTLPPFSTPSSALNRAPAETSVRERTLATVPIVQPASPPLVAEKPVVVPAAAPIAEMKVEFPNLKLQGIYFRLNNPSALINGRTLFVGDRVEGARVVKIERQSITVEFNGQKKMIEL